MRIPLGDYLHRELWEGARPTIKDEFFGGDGEASVCLPLNGTKTRLWRSLVNFVDEPIVVSIIGLENVRYD